MTLKSLDIKAVYSSGSGSDALMQFLIPSLAQSVAYDRAAGYFSSTVFAQSARGISRLVANGGKMRLVTSHTLSSNDISAFQVMDSIDSVSIQALLKDFELAASDTSTLEARMKADHVKAMCWMIREGYLEVKVVIPATSKTAQLESNDFEKFHPKFGILKDSLGDCVAFSGSINETKLGWSGNIENLSVYKGWNAELRIFCESYQKTFDNYWRNQNIDGWKCIPIPEALRLGLAAVAPKDLPELKVWERAQESNEAGNEVRKARGYQFDAVKSWEEAGRVGLLEMATGTGKTFTAKLCIESANTAGTLLTVVVAPYQHIADQWASELAERNTFQLGARGNWQEELQSLLLECQLGLLTELTIVVVKNTAASPKFYFWIKELSGFFDNFLFVGDEVHWLGAQSLRKALFSEANFRLGLSATPHRYFDDEGTKVLTQYFGGESVFKFGLSEALNWLNDDGSIGVLSPYSYHPVFVELTEDENEIYVKYSQRIAQISSKESKSSLDKDELERLLNLRAEVAKKAELKIPALERVLLSMGADLQQALIYCSDFEQMEEAMKVARRIGIETSSRITGLEGSSKSEYFLGKSQREHILSNFSKGRHAVLFAIDCLDEGVDIPSAEIGVILASSGNPKEFIQRRGRLMRRSPGTGKESAKIFDMVVLQGDERLPESLRKTELKRIAEFAQLATNRSDVENLIAALMDGKEGKENG